MLITHSNRALSPEAVYQLAVSQGLRIDDPAQRMGLQALQRCYLALGRRGPARGVYLWGPVGRGKTQLMDDFFSCVPGEQKLRLHFYRFMQLIHQELRQLQGQSDPLKKLARRWSKQYRLLCLDECFVSDIADAMILGRLLATLLDAGVCFVTTSNLHPSSLYKDGLQRQRFEPAIELLLEHLEVVNVAGEIDHRLSGQQGWQHYFLTGESGEQRLAERFSEFSAGAQIEASELAVNRRTIKVKALAEKVLWCEFAELFETARSAADYVALAERFETVLVSSVPILGGGQLRSIARGTEDSAQVAVNNRALISRNEDPARRFISFVDELYDSGVRLCLSAAVPLQQLYPGGALSFEFQRVTSRLVEMQRR